MRDITRILNAIEGETHRQWMNCCHWSMRNCGYLQLKRLLMTIQDRHLKLLHSFMKHIPSLGRDSKSGWESRGHFFAAAAKAMHRTLVDKARTEKTFKRGGGQKLVGLHECQLVAPAASPEDCRSYNGSLPTPSQNQMHGSETPAHSHPGSHAGSSGRPIVVNLAALRLSCCRSTT